MPTPVLLFVGYLEVLVVFWVCLGCLFLLVVFLCFVVVAGEADFVICLL